MGPAVAPPSTVNTEPVQYLASDPAMKHIIAATSPGLA